MPNSKVCGTCGRSRNKRTSHVYVALAMTAFYLLFTPHQQYAGRALFMEILELDLIEAKIGLSYKDAVYN